MYYIYILINTIYPPRLVFNYLRVSVVWNLYVFNLCNKTLKPSMRTDKMWAEMKTLQNIKQQLYDH